MRKSLIALCTLAALGVPAAIAQVSIGINLPVYPKLVQVSGYPVYYAPQPGFELLLLRWLLLGLPAGKLVLELLVQRPWGP